MLISSHQNPRIKQVVKLRRAKHRAETGLILIDGAREIERAVQSGIALRELYLCEPLCHGDEAQQLLTNAKQLAQFVAEVPPAIFEKIAFGDRAEGVLAVADLPRRDLAAIQLPPQPLVAVVEGIEKPGNFGAILRTADAAGVSAVIAADAGTDLFNPNAIRASLGTIFSLPIAAATTAETLAWLRSHELRIVAARLQEARDWRDCDLRPPLAIVLGSEADGLSPAWDADDVEGVRLPMLGIADSLNVANTASVLFYESLRQGSSCR